jgi:hypothetical protein
MENDVIGLHGGVLNRRENVRYPNAFTPDARAAPALVGLNRDAQQQFRFHRRETSCHKARRHIAQRGAAAALEEKDGLTKEMALTNVVVLNCEQMAATVPAGGGLGTGVVNVIYASINGVISFGKFINQ